MKKYVGVSARTMILLYLKFICWVREVATGGQNMKQKGLPQSHPNFEPPRISSHNLDGSSQKDTFRPCMVCVTSDPSALKADIICGLTGQQMLNDKMYLKLAPTPSEVLSQSPPSPPKKLCTQCFSQFSDMCLPTQMRTNQCIAMLE